MEDKGMVYFVVTVCFDKTKAENAYLEYIEKAVQ